MKIKVLLLSVLLILSGCGVKVYEPGEYKTDDFKPVDYNLSILEEKATISVLFRGEDEYQELGIFSADSNVTLPLSKGLLDGFEVEGSTFKMSKIK